MEDFFAQIAQKGIGGSADKLVKNEPEEINVVYDDLKQSALPEIKTKPKMSDGEELKKELEIMRNKYHGFLQDYAPKLEIIKDKIQVCNWLLDGKDITLPHFGGPTGYNKQVYESSFVLDDKKKDKSYYLCFRGADYKAVVYVNGECVGQHEGFFSPFEFNIDRQVKKGNNAVKIELYNDYIYGGNKGPDGVRRQGEKLYAATGLGWDDPQVGWHHCPPGMGIYGDVFVEVRNRLSISDVFVRDNEIRIEVLNDDYDEKDVEFDISVYGQNFKETVTENLRYVPSTEKTVGMGDSLTEAEVKEQIGKGIRMPAEKGINEYVVPLHIKNPKIWFPEEPNLYQIQIRLIYNNTVFDAMKKQFGIRSFVQDINGDIKGMFYLNGEKIRLRGANTMGFEQQDVLNGNIPQLIDDILLAKICNMNFLRLTQRPVQEEVYDYCDRLGLMTQTDLPLFGCMRRNKFAEGIRQAQEMEKIIRNHPCNVIISYINEPFPNASNKPHRHLMRDELEKFFRCCDDAVKLLNPDRVIKHIDGDYDPPCETMPDNHCYPMWYNGHGIDAGLLNKGYWLPTKPMWYYGCGEYGAEGIDSAELMRECYPKEWIGEPFNPNNIVNAQTGNFYYFFYDKGDSMDDWCKKSREYQAFATKFMTEAFRRNNKMISFAIHLFIDAWPSGWMKTIMDCKRKPKPAYFAYRNALKPLMISLRGDRYTFFEGEKVSFDCYVCNDTNKSGKYKIVYEMNGLRAERNIELRANEAFYVSSPAFTVESVNDREKFFLKAILIDDDGNVEDYTETEFEIFQKTNAVETTENEIIFNLPVGKHMIAGKEIEVKKCGMLPVHFVSRKTGHKAVEEFKEKDFSFWYDKKTDMIRPIAETTFTADGFTPVLLSGNKDENGNWHSEMVCGEKVFNGKRYIISNIDLRVENPVAYRFLNNLRNL